MLKTPFLAFTPDVLFANSDDSIVFNAKKSSEYVLWHFRKKKSDFFVELCYIKINKVYIIRDYISVLRQNCV